MEHEAHKQTNRTAEAIRPRFRHIGRRASLISGAIVILLSWLSLGLGFVAFIGFLYLHLLLAEADRPLHGYQEGEIIAPLDGRILAIRRKALGQQSAIQIDIMGHLTGSQVIYAPANALIEDKLWIDGSYLPFEDEGIHPLRARYDFMMQLSGGAFITLSLFGGSWTRYLHAPFSEGQHIRAGEPFAYGIARSLITLDLPAGYERSLQKGDYLIACQTMLASKS